MSKKILLPFDGSPASLHAARHVARNLEGLDASVLLVNVQRVVIDAEMLHAARSIADLHRRDGEDVLRIGMSILEDHGVRHEAEISFGPPVPVIVRLAEERGCDLIVMGTRARHPIVEFLARSIASRVTRRSRVPVMLVRHSPSLQERTLPWLPSPSSPSSTPPASASSARDWPTAAARSAR